jgi:hypothetical protein
VRGIIKSKMTSGASYTPSRFPFAAIFAGLTDYAQSHTCSAIDLYIRYQQERRRARLTPCPDYASTSITSGGHARRAGMEMMQIIAANTRTAREMVSLMEHQGALDRESVILPVDLGHVPGWRQSDYIHFWLLVIGGTDLRLRPGNSRLRQYEKELDRALIDRGVDLMVMNDFNKSAAERAPEYFRYADACVQAAKLSKADREATPARKIVSLVDPQVSLGGQTERYFARTLGIPVYLPRAVRPARGVGEAITVRRLARDVETIISFGGTVCEVAPHPAMVCLRDDMQLPADTAQLRGGLH